MTLPIPDQWTQAPGVYEAPTPTDKLFIGPHNIFVRNGLAINDRSNLECYWVEDAGGFDSADVSVSSTPNTQSDGAVAEPAFYGERTMTLTGYIRAGSYIKALNMSRDLLDAFIGLVEMPLLITTQAGLIGMPDLGYFHMPDVTINARPSDRPQVSNQIQQEDISGLFKRSFTLAVRASDPVFRAVTPQNTVLIPSSTSENGRHYNLTFGRAYTVTVPTGSTANTATLHNAGNYDAHPIITFHGAMTGAVLTNFTTGQVLRVPAALSTGQVVSINIATGAILDENGANAASKWDSTSDWMFLRGTRDSRTGMPSTGGNDLKLTVTALGTGARVTFDWADTWI